MGCVHVDQHQAGSILGENVDAFELGQGVPQGRDVALALRQRRRRSSVIVQRLVELAVDRQGLGSGQWL
ncbi:hypothetical protein D3C81_2142140 [compost metagenome]